MLVVTWVSFLFAPGLPILFPIGLLGQTVLYFTNRFALAYHCVRPTYYSPKILQTPLRMLRIAPFLYMAMGAWVYSNQQVFRDEITTMDSKAFFMPSGHTFKQFFE